MLKWTIFLVLWSFGALAQRRPLVPEDLWQWRTPADPVIRADGTAIVYVEHWNHREHDDAFSNLRWVDTKGGEAAPLTEGEWHDRAPRWSPDGARIAFLSDRSGTVQIHVLRVAAPHEIAVLTAGNVKPLSLAWSPDGRQLAFTARIAIEPARPAWAPPELLPLIEPLRRDIGQLFVVPAAGGAAVRITSADLDYAGEPAWMPDGRSLVCAASGQIVRIALADRSVRALTENNSDNSDARPSPDGTKVAWLGRERKPQNYRVRHLWVMNADGSRARMLSGALDRDAAFPEWSNDSRTVYFLADDRGSTHLYAGRNDGTARQVTSRAERLTGFTLADNGRAATIRSTATEGGVVITFAADVPGGVVKLGEPNDRLMAERTLGEVQEIAYESDGKTVQAWLVKPPRFDREKKYPLAVEIRDAPRAMYGVELQWRAQVLANAGYVVLCANPRGAPGYGEEFGRLLRTRFPGDDADDVLRGVDFVVKQGYIDTQHISMTGGVVAAWLLGHTDRFTRAVARHAIADWASDVALWPAHATEWMGAMPWEDPEQYTKRSPLFSAGEFRTPTLVIAGADDPGSEQLYFALQQRKVESALVRIAGDGPSAQVIELKAILAWLER